MRSDTTIVTRLGWILAAAYLAVIPGAGADPTADPEGWRRVEIGGSYSLALPPELTMTNARGTDSLYRRFVAENLVVSIDYGWYSSCLSEITAASVVRTPTRVDGRDGIQLVWEEPEEDARLRFRAGVHVPVVGPERVRFTLLVEAKTPEQRTRALRVARSIRFLQPEP